MTPFAQMSLIIFLAACLGALVTIIRQPPLIGYIVAGMVLGFLGLTTDQFVQFETMSQLGVTLLLFLVGMELTFTDIRAMGRLILTIALSQILISFILGFLLALGLGLTPLSSLYQALALSFASTVVAVKLLSQKGDLTSLHGKMAVGILLVQDFVAILILMVLGGLNFSTSFTLLSFVVMLVKGAILLYLTLFLSQHVFPRLMRLAALSAEMVFVTSIAWALGFATLVSLAEIGFSIEIGGFLAGLALANSAEHYQIISRIRPLRDFFVTIFFIFLGVKLMVVQPLDFIVPALTLSIFVLVSHPFIIIILMGLLGFRKRTGALTGFSLAQISEFGLIIVTMGNKLGHIPVEIVSQTAIVAVVTMTVSTYMILSGHKLYRLLSTYLNFFEKKHLSHHPLVTNKQMNNHIIVIGYHRTGRILVPVLLSFNQPLLVVDFNPKAIDQLTTQGIPALYGDSSDYELLDLLSLDKAQMVISTVTDVEDNLAILEKVSKLKNRPLTIMVAAFPKEALKLYEAKADFVLIPHLVGGEHLAHLLSDHAIDRNWFTKQGKHQFEQLLNEWGKPPRVRSSNSSHSLTKA